MRPISGFERPALQRAFVALSLVLVAAVGGATYAARRAQAAAGAAQAALDESRLERQHLEARLARERSTREALTLELARQRQTGAQPMRLFPTLTLTPVATRGHTPPEPTAATQHATQVIELRLVLPAGAERHRRFDVVLRDWSTGEAVWSRGGLAATTVDRQRILSALVTGDVFRAAAYELLVSGAAPVGQKAEVASYEVAFK